MREGRSGNPTVEVGHMVDVPGVEVVGDIGVEVGVVLREGGQNHRTGVDADCSRSEADDCNCLVEADQNLEGGDVHSHSADAAHIRLDADHTRSWVVSRVARVASYQLSGRTWFALGLETSWQTGSS